MSSGHHLRSGAEHKQVESAYDSTTYDEISSFLRTFLRYSHHDRKKGGPEENAEEKVGKERPVPSALNGACEAQLWTFVGSQRILNAAEVHWVAAESLDAALRYMRQRNDDFTIIEARFLGMIPLLSGSPLD